MYPDKEQEVRFLRDFIRKEKRERLQYELWNPEKRRYAMGRFCHNAEGLLDKSRLILDGRICDDQILELLPSGQCYVMAFCEELEGVYPDGKAAAERVLQNGMAAVMLAGNTAVIETEQGISERYVLRYEKAK